MLQIRDLHGYYGKSHILQGIDLDVGEGEIVSLLGRNGVGRSTTIKAIMGEVEPHGSINSRARKSPDSRHMILPAVASATSRKTGGFSPP